jgi:hypothetical protein
MGLELLWGKRAHLHLIIVDGAMLLGKGNSIMN